MTVQTTTQGRAIPVRYIGRRLRDAREDAGMTQADLAAATGMSRRSIGIYESSTDDVRRAVVIAYHFATQAPLEWLLTGAGDPDPVECAARDLNPQPAD